MVILIIVLAIAAMFALSLVPGRLYIDVRDYVRMRKQGFDKGFCWRISDMPRVIERLVNTGALILVGCLVGFLISDRANASVPVTPHPQGDYVKGLERIVAACLSDATGKPVKIGGEIFLCGITSIGEFN
jgi:hypothetical protein